MATLSKSVPNGAECVFSKCGQSATHTYRHEFLNRPVKYLCTSHAAVIAETFKMKVEQYGNQGN